MAAVKKLGRGPFSGKKIELAPLERIEDLRTVADEFMSAIFDFLPGDYLITDESTLSDFTEMGSGDTSSIWAQITEQFGVERAHVRSEKLVDIFTEIRARKTLQ